MFIPLSLLGNGSIKKNVTAAKNINATLELLDAFFLWGPRRLKEK
jgi:hypothetical protein